jgi:hypothetical protein
MVIAANPDKGKTEEEKAEMAKKYKPGDQVIPQLNIRQRTAEQRAADAQERRLIEEAQELSLAEAGIGSTLSPRQRRRGEESRSADGRSRRSGERSRQRSESDHRRRSEDDRRQPEPPQSQRRSRDERRARRRSESRRRSERQVEHQSSLRSLLSSDHMSERDIEREIEDFARQIQEEGLLEGLDLDNIDLTRDDELSRKITEAYRRRQRARPRTEASRRSNASNASNVSRVSDVSAVSDVSRSEIRPPSADSSQGQPRQRVHSRSTSATGQNEDRSRPPPAPSSSAHLEVHGEDRQRRQRRRTASGGRSATTPIVPTQSQTRATTRSQSDLSGRFAAADAAGVRPAAVETRSSSSPAVTASVHSPTEITTSSELSFASRAAPVVAVTGPTPLSGPSPPDATTSPPRIQRTNRPIDLTVISQALPISIGSPTSPGHRRTPSQLFPEPSISCSRCSRPHIEYDLHYNCATCAGGNWHLCLDCYRTAKGCLHWFGFGYGAWAKWNKARQSNASLAQPHMLTANRYRPPKITPGGADGRRTLTAEDPYKRLQSGNFCANCQSWANDCYWRCDICNEGDWGFCNKCVNQGLSCTHPLLPLAYLPQQVSTPPASPRSAHLPRFSSILTGPNVANIGPFKPLTFTTRCEICQNHIQPIHNRFHCYDCVSNVAPDASPGDYNICMNCYGSLVSTGKISPENGPIGWRRCPKGGHRMVVTGFREEKGGQRRILYQDVPGGLALNISPFESPEYSNGSLEKWWWTDNGGRRLERLVTRDVAGKAPTSVGNATFTHIFPPEGGVGVRGTAGWSWHPHAEDELMFPRGAEVREIVDVNGDWFFGSYMGKKGLFPAPYVKMPKE